MLVVDANVAMVACAAEDGFDSLAGEELVAPPLMWSEFRSGLHEARWRGEVSHALVRATLRLLGGSPIRQRTHRNLGEQAWRLADELGWAKTYEAEYVALAQLLGCRLVTLDDRLRRGATRLGFVIGPNEL